MAGGLPKRISSCVSLCRPSHSWGKGCQGAKNFKLVSLVTQLGLSPNHSMNKSWVNPPAHPCEGQPAARKFVPFCYFLTTVDSLLPTVCFLETAARCFTVVSGPQKRLVSINFRPAQTFWTRLDSVISSLSPRHQNHENRSQGKPKSLKMDPRIMRIPIFAKSWFFRYFRHENLF